MLAQLSNACGFWVGGRRRRKMHSFGLFQSFLRVSFFSCLTQNANGASIVWKCGGPVKPKRARTSLMQQKRSSCSATHKSSAAQCEWARLLKIMASPLASGRASAASVYATFFYSERCTKDLCADLCPGLAYSCIMF